MIYKIKEELDKFFDLLSYSDKYQAYEDYKKITGGIKVVDFIRLDIGKYIIHMSNIDEIVSSAETEVFTSLLDWKMSPSLAKRIFLSDETDNENYFSTVPDAFYLCVYLDQIYAKNYNIDENEYVLTKKYIALLSAVGQIIIIADRNITEEQIDSFYMYINLLINQLKSLTTNGEVAAYVYLYLNNTNGIKGRLEIKDFLSNNNIIVTNEGISIKNINEQDEDVLETGTAIIEHNKELLEIQSDAEEKFLYHQDISLAQRRVDLDWRLKDSLKKEEAKYGLTLNVVKDSVQNLNSGDSGHQSDIQTPFDQDKEMVNASLQIPTFEEDSKNGEILRQALEYREETSVPTVTESSSEAEIDAEEECSSVDTNEYYKDDQSEPLPDVSTVEHVEDTIETSDVKLGISSDSVVHLIKNPYNIATKENLEDSVPVLEGFADAAETVTAAESKEPPKPKYKFPPYDLLALPKRKDTAAGDAEIMQQCSVLEQTLADFRVRAKVVAATRGPAVTQFELQPAPGVKVNSVVNLSDDIALRLAAPGVRIEAPIPGKSVIGIEVPNLKTDPVVFREVVDTDVVRSKSGKLCIGLGKDISGHVVTADIAKMPHLLIAGSTGSGKSVCINTIICGILYKASPEEVKLILIDPKIAELCSYDYTPHLLTPVITDPKNAARALHWAVAEMDKRYRLFADNRVRNFDGYNKVVDEKIPYIVIIIDELADLMAVVKEDIESTIQRLSIKGRAAGIHLILATERPSVDVVTGVIKNNIPSRIAFSMPSRVDSRTILGRDGAETLLGNGDMLFAPAGSPKPTRVQGAFVSDEEVGSIVDFIIAQSIPTEYSDEITSVELECDKQYLAQQDDEYIFVSPSPSDDPLFQKALMLVLDTGLASASMMQRRFSIGYNRAARLVDTMADLGVVGKSMGSKPREVIMSRQEAEQRFLNKEQVSEENINEVC